MTKQQKLEAFRRRLAKRTNINHISRDLTTNIFLVDYYLKEGIETIMEWSPWRFNQISRELTEQLKRESDAYKGHGGGTTTLG